jgi:hypothetical protein
MTSQLKACATMFIHLTINTLEIKMRTAKVKENILKSTLNMKMIHPWMNKVLIVLIQVVLTSLVQLQVQAHQLKKLKIH